ncbi:hypothetical protein [Companilactobacillus jidongensis]|uniref:hypothetical protein n=1 Tax=Companilactobacillus jidongensis TaxID=2486006 RepID=UPI000F7A9261|nr:hypothetical protein [Companilactobacillus jidongensis]
MNRKIKYLFLVLVPLFFILLTGCSKLDLSTTKSEYSADGLVAVVKGKATDYDKLTYTVSGVTKNVKVTDDHFAISVPVATKSKNVKIKAKKGNDTKTKIVKVTKANELIDYTTFAQQYNFMNLKMGKQTDQLPLIAKDGIFTYTTSNGTKLRMNVQGGQLMGIAMNITYKSMKSKSGMKDFGTDLVLISQYVGADGKKVVKKLGDEVKDADGGTTTMKQITSKGVNYNVSLATKDFYLYITK